MGAMTNLLSPNIIYIRRWQQNSITIAVAMTRPNTHHLLVTERAPYPLGHVSRSNHLSDSLIDDRHFYLITTPKIPSMTYDIWFDSNVTISISFKYADIYKIMVFIQPDK